MTDEEEGIAFEQWKKDWGHNFPGVSNCALFSIYRSMDLDCRLEFLEESKRTGLYQKEIKRHKKYGEKT